MIDWDRVAELRAEVGDDGFHEVVELFLEETDEAVERLSQGLQLAQDLHFLKGGALNLGFRDLARLCQDGERLAGTGRGAEVDLPATLHLYRESKAAFQRGLAQRSAA